MASISYNETWVNFEDWLVHQRALLELERNEELQEVELELSSSNAKECQEKGVSLLSLMVKESRTVLFGRTCYRLGRMSGAMLPTHGFKVGDEVCVYSTARDDTNKERKMLVGSVTKVSGDSIEMTNRAVAGDDSDDVAWVPPLRLDKRPNDTTHKRLVACIDALADVGNTSAWLLREYLFHNKQVPAPPLPLPALKFVFNTGLNESQLGAVAHCLASKLSLIHGPPGTGKTTTVVELVRQSVVRGEKVLVVAPSNAAVDNVLEAIVTSPKALPVGFGSSCPTARAVRIGHPVRVSASVMAHTLESLIHRHDGTEIVHDVRRAIEIARGRAENARDGTSRREYRAEARALRKELRTREDRVVKEIMRTSNVVCATCIGAASRLLQGVVFDRVIIDEAAQTTELACWIAMMKAPVVTLAGDHCQLPPTIKSQAAIQGGLGITLFQRIMASKRNPELASIARLLDTQYRMHASICDWASAAMYGGKLKAHPSVAGHTLLDLTTTASGADRMKGANTIEGAEEERILDDDSFSPLLLIDTMGCDMEESGSAEGSKSNASEVQLVMQHVTCLVARGIPQENIGVITPYNGQLRLLKEACSLRFPAVQSKTVDGFQGGEKEAIVVSLVRSNNKGQVGFLSDSRRINVAVTRARRQLAVVADSGTVTNDAFVRSLVEHMEERGVYRSAVEYSDHGAVGACVSTSTDAPKRSGGTVSAIIPSSASSTLSKGASHEPTSKSVLPHAKKSPTTTTHTAAAGTKTSAAPATTAQPVDEDRGGDEMTGGASVFDPVLAAALVEVEKIASSGGRVELSSSLTSYQRMRVHEMAEAKKVHHESIGEGKERRVVMWGGAAKGMTPCTVVDVEIGSELPVEEVTAVESKSSFSGLACDGDDAESEDGNRSDDDGDNTAPITGNDTSRKAKKKKKKKKGSKGKGKGSGTSDQVSTSPVDATHRGLWGARTGGVNILGGTPVPAQISTTHRHLVTQPTADMSEDDYLEAAMAANAYSRPREHQFRLGKAKALPKF